ncbi:MAG TPA: hypothetical protein VNH11_35315 [Pirellulales bacterium]|nr:hypothetical protein [Pirellulales bacterium]
MLVESVWLAVQWWLTRREELIYMFFVIAVLAVELSIEWHRDKQAK